MTRQEITTRIYELHEQLQKTDFGPIIIDCEKLQAKLERMDDLTLATVMRFFAALNEPDQE